MKSIRFGLAAGSRRKSKNANNNFQSNGKIG